MPSKAVLGETEHHVLLAAARLGDRAHTVAIVREIEARTGRAVAPAAVYIALRRLERHKLVKSHLVTEKGDWRSRRLVEITEAGRRQLRASRERLLRLWDGLDPIWEGPKK
jgi:DNA-binding PadR family transcriptional regulator